MNDRFEQPERWYKEAAEEIAAALVYVAITLSIAAIVCCIILTS